MKFGRISLGGLAAICKKHRRNGRTDGRTDGWTQTKRKQKKENKKKTTNTLGARVNDRLSVCVCE
jgi:hypothetical protein